MCSDTTAIRLHYVLLMVWFVLIVPKNKPYYDQGMAKYGKVLDMATLLVGIRLFSNIGTCFYSRIYEKLRFNDTVKDKISIQMNK